MNAPKVSVLIPVYNAAPYLEETVQSVLAQTFGDYEVIITDNCSTDDSYRIAQSFTTDSRVRVYRNHTNVGMAGNWNRCLEFAKGEYIKFLCADDKFHPQLLEKFVAVLDQHPDVAIVTSFRQAFGSETKLIKPPFEHYQDGQKIIRESLITWNWIGEPSSVMFRRQNLWIGNFKTELKWIIDWDMWLRQLTLGACYIIPEPLSYFRHHEEQGTALLRKDFIDAFEEYNFFRFIKGFRYFKAVENEPRFVQSLRLRARNCVLAAPALIAGGKTELIAPIMEIVEEQKLIRNPMRSLVKLSPKWGLKMVAGNSFFRRWFINWR